MKQLGQNRELCQKGCVSWKRYGWLDGSQKFHCTAYLLSQTSDGRDCPYFRTKEWNEGKYNETG